MSFLKRAFGLMAGEDDPFMFNNGGLASLTTGLGGTLGGSVMGSSRPSSILGIGRGISAFDPSAFPVADLTGSFQPGNRAEATQFRRDFLKETGTPALNEMGQPFITEDQIQQRIDDAISLSRKDMESSREQNQSWRMPYRARSFQDGGLV